MEIVAIVDPHYGHASFAQFPVVPPIEAAAGTIDALLLTTLADPQAAYDLLVQSFPASVFWFPRCCASASRRHDA